ncbi:nucleotidyltransferase family protein [Orrella sp. 11846]|uniref:nucleotidyltransferase family protein n=1 Tax=Orrella sp. 11846 TaxID=3409913 RepID=UPI003B5BE0F6
MSKIIPPLFHEHDTQPSDNRFVIHGLLLAAGRGRRFDPTGQQHKLLVPVAPGLPMIRLSTQQLLPWVQTLTVVVGPHNLGVVRALAGLPVRIRVCEQADLGQGVSLRSGLTDAPPDVQGWLIALADMPWIAQTTYQQVRQALEAGLACEQAAVWQPVYQKRPGHPVAVTKALAQAYLAQDLDPETGLSALWRQNPQIRQTLMLDDAGCIQDVDHPTDLPVFNS